MGKKAEQNKQQKRIKLMYSAYELFTTVGFTKTTILDITNRAGVAKGTFYLYFADKTAIRDAVIRNIASMLLYNAYTSMEEHIAKQEEPLSVADKFIYIIDYIVEYVAGNLPLLGLIEKNLTWGLFTKHFDEPAPGKPAPGNSIDFEGFIRGMLERDYVKIRDFKLLMFTLIDLINSTIYDSLIYEEPVGLEEYKPYLNRCIRMLINDAIIE